MSAGRLPRPPRPLALATRTKAFIAEVIDLALADGLVAQCDIAGEDPGYVLTPLGEACSLADGIALPLEAANVSP